MFLHDAARRLFDRVPRAEALTLRALDSVYQVALLPFRRPRPARDVARPVDLVGRTDQYNAAAERYFARFENPQFLLDKPFSDPHLLPKHLVDAGVLIEMLRLKGGDVVAEIGAGSCWLSHMLNRFGCSTMSIDVSPTALALGRQLFERDPRTNWTLQPRFETYDGHRLPLADGSCEGIVINDAFHHVPNQRELLAEMHRVLTPDGVVAMSEPGAGHGTADHSVEEASTGVLENELVLEQLAELACACGFQAVNVVLASPHVHPEIPARDLGAFMGGRGFAGYWKALCSALEQHHYILLYKGPATATTRRPGRLIARIDAPSEIRVRAGARARVSLRIRNIGDTTWVSAEGPGWTRVGAHLYRATPTADLVDFDWYRASLPFDVDPAAQVTIDLLLPATPTNGEFLLRLDLVVEGLTWFSDRGSSAATMRLTVEP
jgi:SAM-dependent methyltransferase